VIGRNSTRVLDLPPECEFRLLAACSVPLSRVRTHRRADVPSLPNFYVDATVLPYGTPRFPPRDGLRLKITVSPALG
jgi:hypothetical protein